MLYYEERRETVVERNIVIEQKLDAFKGSVLNEEFPTEKVFIVSDALINRIPICIIDTDQCNGLIDDFENRESVCIYVVYSTWKTTDVAMNADRKYGRFFEGQTINGNIIIDASNNTIAKELVDNYYREQVNSDTNPINTELENFLRKTATSNMVYYDINHKDGVEISRFSDCAEYVITLSKQMFPLFPEQLALPYELYQDGLFIKWVKAAIKLDETVFADATPKEAFASLWTADGTIKNSNVEDIPAVTKRNLDEFISTKMKQDGRVGFSEIMGFLKQAPYGLVGNRLSAYYMALLLRSYMSEGYYCSDGLISGPMDEDYLRTAIVNQIKSFYQRIPSRRENYIVKREPAIEEFITISREIYDISEEIVSIEDLRQSIRKKLTGLAYPLWAINRVTDDGLIKQLVNYYMDFVRGDYTRSSSDMPLISMIVDAFNNNDGLKPLFIEYLSNDELAAEWKETLETISKSPVTSEWKWIWDEETLLLLR